ncbi:GNAT family N-acetyltransferase [Streptomyces sp. TR06-5]|uniref:GNAT family N-acetyltransferase n=1 Tax=unclassified Streptomyces TaxID=2593676 RepID=UPI00399FEC36
MDTELRLLRDEPDDLDGWYGVIRAAFGTTFAPESRDKWSGVIEHSRSLVAQDGGEMCGTSGAFSFRMTVPGGTVVPTAGVTMVSVKPTHRRRGVLTAMMRRLLDDVHDRGEPLAVLRASEPAIYGRFGFGAASEEITARVDTLRAGLVPPPGADAVRLRLVEAGDDAVVAACERLYAARVPLRPGMLERRPGWERVPLHDPPSHRRGATPVQCVLAERDGELCGYARYAVRAGSDEVDNAEGEVLLHDLEALDPAAHGALLRFLFETDLTCRLVVDGRPLDDPWLHMVTDVRRCHVALRDGIHLRVVDVAEALGCRAYAAPVDVVFEVEDPFCPWNEGRWRLTGDSRGAECVPARGEADLALTARELGSVLLGGTPLSALAAAGRVREKRKGAVAEASRAFLSDVAPWNPHGF